jgi:hypothetical protein
MEDSYSSIADAEPPAERWDLTLRVTVIERNLANLYTFPRGKRAARRADGDAGKGCRKKRMLACNGRDRVIPDSKECRLPTGLESQDRLKEKRIKEA